MCRIAMEVERGRVWGTYDGALADRYARGLPMPQGSSTRPPGLPDPYLATWFAAPRQAGRDLLGWRERGCA